MSVDPSTLAVLSLAFGDSVSTLGTMVATDGMQVYVPSANGGAGLLFTYHMRDVQVPDGSTIVAGLGGGNWLAGSLSGVSTAGAISAPNLTWPASVAVPIYEQSQGASGGGSLMRFISQPAAAGSVNVGGDVSFVIGKKDGNPNNLAYIRFGEALTTNQAAIVEGIPSGYKEYSKISFNSGFNCNWNFGGLTALGVELSGQCPVGIATESTNTTNIGGYISFIPASRQLNGNNFHAQWNCITNDDGAPLFQMTVTGGGNSQGPQGANSAGVNGYINIDWANSSVHQDILVQRNSGASSDVPLLTRWLGLLTWGSLAEDQQSYALSKHVHRLLAPNGGHQFAHQSPNTAATVTDLAVAGDTQSSIVQGDILAGTSDARIIQRYQTNTTTTSAGTVIATIPIRTNGVHHLYARIQGKSGTDYAAFLHEWTVINNAGTVTIAGSQPAAIDKGHTAAAVNIIPQFAVSGTNINITVTPWTATATHWTAYVESMVNMSSATAPAAPTPPGSPAFFFNADAQSTGATSTLTDQSGNGRNFAIQGSGTIPSITGSTGPNGVQNSLVLAASGRWYARADGLGLGTSNFTMAQVIKYTVASNSQIGFQVGQAAGAWMGTSQALSGYRDMSLNPQGGNQINVFGGLATTAWEIQILTSDANGNLTLVVNGQPQSLNPVHALCVAANAVSSIAAGAASNAQVTGNLYWVGAWATAQDPMAVYAYLHALTGL